MMFYKHDFAIEKVLRSGPSLERTILRIYTGSNLSETDAKTLWQRIADHKWYVSERLSRDVGFHVAAIDYVENFYEPFSEGHRTGKFAKFGRAVLDRTKAIAIAKKYFESKGGAMPI